MDTGWGASLPNRPITIRSVVVLVVVEEVLLPSVVDDRPLNSKYILSVMIASDVDLVSMVIVVERGSTTLLLLLLPPTSLEGAANASHDDTGAIVAVAAANDAAGKVRRCCCTVALSK